MTAVASLEDVKNSPFVSYDALLIAIDAQTRATPAVEAALETRQLSRCTKPFGVQSTEARQAICSLKLKLPDGTTSVLAEKEKDVALAVADNFALNETDAAVLLRGKRLDAGRSVDDLTTDEEAVTEAFLDQFFVYYLHQRLQALRLATQLFVMDENIDEDMTGSSIAGIAVSCVQKLDKRGLAISCIAEYTARCLDTMPDCIRVHPRRAAFFAKQLLREQIALLTLAFLCCNQIAVDADITHAVLDAAQKTKWATAQDTEAFFDASARSDASLVEHLMTLLSISILNLEIAALPGSLSALGSPTTSSLHPDNLNKVHDVILALVNKDAVKAAPLLFGWALVLYRLTRELENAEEPMVAYDTFNAHVQPAFYEQALTHVLDPRCHLFANLSQILTSALTSGPYAVLFLDVLRGLIVSLPQMVHIAHLQPAHYEAYLSLFVQLYASSSAEPLRERFWNAEDYLSQVEQGFVSSVESRFPAQPDDTLRLLTALAAPGIFDHFDALPSLTFANAKSALFTPRGRGPTASAPIRVTRSVFIPEGTTGQELSLPGADLQIVKWDMLDAPWSGWTLLSDIMTDVAGVSQSSTALVTRDDVFDSVGPLSPLWKSLEERDRLLGSALDLLAATLEHEEVQLFDDILDVQVLFSLLPIKPAQVLQILIHLLSRQASAIWINLQGTSVFPRIANRLVREDKNRGSYSNTKALIRMALHLFLEARNRIPSELEQTKKLVLDDALAWVRDEVWAHHRGWRYTARKERYELSEQLSSMMSEIVEDNGLISRDFAQSMLNVPLRQTTIISTISTGASAIHALAAEGRVEEAEIVRAAVASVLQLTVTLLSARRHVLGIEPSALEQALLSVTPIDHIISLMKFTNLAFAEHSPMVAREACRVLAALTALLPDWPTPQPTLLAHFDEAAVGSLVGMLESDRPDRDLQVALWTFAAAAVETQPGLAMLLVSGRAIRDDSDKQTRPSAVDLAIAALEPADQDDELKATLYRFLDTAWQRIADYAVILKGVRAQQTTWNSVVNLITASPAPSSVDISDVAHTCFGALARAAACNMLATDIRYACLSSPAEAPQAASVKAFLSAFKAPDKLQNAAVGFLRSACDPSLLQELRRNIKLTHPAFELEVHRRPLTNVPALDTARRFGDGYLYPQDMVLAALQATDYEAGLEAIEHVNEIDDLHALMDTQMLALIAWRRLLEEARPLMRMTPDVALPVLKTISQVAREIAKESQSGDMIALLHAERLGTVLALLDALPESIDAPAAFAEATLALRKAYDLDALSPLDALRDRKQSAYHRPLLGSAFLLAQRLRGVIIPEADRITLSRALDDILRSALLSLRIVLAFKPDKESDADLSLLASVAQSIIELKDAPAAAVWVAYMLEDNIFPTLFAFISSMQIGTQRLLSLCISMASFPLAAERMATEGCLAALTSNALSSVVRSGHLASDDERHPVWVLSLTLAVVITTHVGIQVAFMEQVLAFARHVAPQLARALHWKADGMLSMGLLDEMEASISLLRCITARPTSSGDSVGFVALFIPLTMALVDEASEALSHMNTLIASFTASTPEQRAWLESEKGSGLLNERAVAGPLTQTFLGILCQLCDMLVAWSQALVPLTRDIVDWPFDRLLTKEYPAIVQNTREAHLPCIGGLLQLADVCIDILSATDDVKAVTVPKLTRPPLPMSPFSSATTRTHATHVLEATLLLSTSQCVVCARRNDGEPREEVVDELLEYLKRGAAAVKSASGRGSLLSELSRYISRQMAQLGLRLS